MGDQADYVVDDMMDDPGAWIPPVYTCNSCNCQLGEYRPEGNRCPHCGGSVKMVR